MPIQQPIDDPEALYEESPVTQEYPNEQTYFEPTANNEEATYESVPEPQQVIQQPDDVKVVFLLQELYLFISFSKQMNFARASHSFKAEQDYELNLAQNDVIAAVEIVDESWCKGLDSPKDKLSPYANSQMFAPGPADQVYANFPVTNEHTKDSNLSQFDHLEPLSPEFDHLEQWFSNFFSLRTPQAGSCV
ncbi:hypothetical protein LOD99_12393 [Oopsacas minuta]|uniref:SH3 domain-containing protein n=1 Tax=Oopsacas minuta TaxID=111878 RepID=A0AAV7JF46_9METZ|nr:hypothetical protein LOD99_12393 [Oopsacas minuta]